MKVQGSAGRRLDGEGMRGDCVVRIYMLVWRSNEGFARGLVWEVGLSILGADLEKDLWWDGAMIAESLH